MAEMVKNTEEAMAAHTGAQVFGNPDAWVLLAKFQSDTLMKTTKVIQIGPDCLIQTETQHSDKYGNVLACSQALAVVENMDVYTLRGR